MIVIPNRAPSPVRNLLLLAWSTHSCPLALGFVLERETQPALMFHHRAKRDREGHDFQSCRKELFEFSASAAGVRLEVLRNSTTTCTTVEERPFEGRVKECGIRLGFQPL
jgi:hypothetical protein